MRTLFVLLAFAVMVLDARIYRPSNDIRKDTILINRPTMRPRFPRSAQSDNRGRNTVNVQVQKPMSGPDRRPNINIDYQRKIWESQRGHISAGGGISKFPGQKPQTHVGVQGVIRFKREANPLKLMDHYESSSDADVKEQPLIDTYYKLFNEDSNYAQAHNEENTVSDGLLSEEADHKINNKVKREADPQGSIIIHGQKPMSGPDRRPSWGADYQHNIWKGKNGEINTNGGFSKFPGSRPDYHVGIGGTWRFKREANPQGSIVVQGQKPMSGPDRRPSVNVDYQHKIWENKHGHISAGGGVSKTPGQKPNSHVGIQGTFRFKRNANGNNEEAIV